MGDVVTEKQGDLYLAIVLGFPGNVAIAANEQDAKELCLRDALQIKEHVSRKKL